jgi:UDP-N-acetylmuramate dehydrogenase
MTLTALQKERLLVLTNGEVLFDEPLASHSTIRIGGPGDALIRPRDSDSLKKIIGFAVEEGVPYTFIGAGSNTLIRDKGVRGIIINFADGFNQLDVIRETPEEIVVLAGAGLHTGSLVKFASDNGLAGAEGLTGIPGVIGGNIITNAGTAWGCMADVVEEITVVDRQLKQLSITRKALEFSYRSLRIARSTAVISASLKLKRSDKNAVAGRINEIMEKRRSTQPYNFPTLGCVFKNPADTSRLAAHGSRVDSAGALIDDAGLKGVRVGRARVSELHANFIVNEGGATARDVEVLIGLVKEQVRQKFSISLETEIKIIGEV